MPMKILWKYGQRGLDIFLAECEPVNGYEAKF